jgi:putative inorganic carbon (HCO3(-)) transporter
VLGAARLTFLATLATMALPSGLAMNVALAVTLALGVTALGVGALPAPRSALGWLLLAFAVAATMSAMGGLDPWCGFDSLDALLRGRWAGKPITLWCGVRGVLDIVRAGLVFLLAAALLGPPRARKLWLGVILAVTTIVASAGFVQYATGVRSGGEFLRTPAVGHSNQTAAFLVIALPIAVLAATRGEDARLRWLAGLAVATGGVALVLTQSLAAFVAGAAVTSILLSAVRRRAVLVTGALAVAGVAAVIVPAWTKFSAAWLTMSVGSRLDWWSGALRLIGERPLLGIGPRNVMLVDHRAYGFSPSSHVHNQYLNLAVEQGVVGLALFMALALAVAYRLRLTRPLIATDMDTVCWYGTAAALLGLLVLGLATTPHHSRTALVFWAIIGLFYAQFGDRVGARPRDGDTRPAPRDP